MKRRPYQSSVLRREGSAGFILLIWRRQGGKSTTMAEVALKQMMKVPGRLVTFASASLLVGREIIQKESQVLWSAMADLQKQAAEASLKLDTANRDTGKLVGQLALDDFTELYEAQRLEFRLYHDRTRYSRTLVIAPNVATARGFSGSVMIDEIGFINDFKELWEAMEPIASSDPSFRVMMATTPPNDDAHYSFELAVPPDGLVFPATGEGNWYMSQAGVLCHRVDVFDAEQAGVKLYDLNTRQPIAPVEHRKRALDKDAWDRNYGLKFKHGGAAACSLTSLSHAQTRGAALGVAADLDADETALAPALVRLSELIGAGPIGLGYDIATTESGVSNPSSLTVAERVGLEDVVRLVLRWKTADPARAREILTAALETIARRKAGGNARRLAVDATSERYFATDLRRDLGHLVYVELVIASETTEFDGEEMTIKTYLGNQLVNRLEDALLALPGGKWLKDDFRLVMRHKGSFDNQTDSAGNHGDTFDSTKLAIHALQNPFSGALDDPSAVIIAKPKFRPVTRTLPGILGGAIRFAIRTLEWAGGCRDTTPTTKIDSTPRRSAAVTMFILEPGSSKPVFES